MLNIDGRSTSMNERTKQFTHKLIVFFRLYVVSLVSEPGSIKRSSLPVYTISTLVLPRMTLQGMKTLPWLAVTLLLEVAKTDFTES